jgi:hypothetical protein
MMKFKFLTLGVVMLGTYSCGSSTLPQARVVEAESEIKAAETIGAASHPRAALHLKLAREGVASANSLAKDAEEELANLALQRAQIDAELAVALTQEAQAKQRAVAAQRRITELQTK